MPDARGENSPNCATRMRDITSWKEGNVSALRSREKKRYSKRKAAVEAYFTTEVDLDKLSLRHHLSSEILLKLVRDCSMQHEDGSPWGYRALLPGVEVIDHAPQTPGLPPLVGATACSDPPCADQALDPQISSLVPTRHPVRALPGGQVITGNPPTTDEQAETEGEQTSLLVEDVDEDAEVDTAKRQAVKLPNPTPVLLEVPETPVPPAGEGEDEVERTPEDVSPMDEEARSELDSHGEALDAIEDTSDEEVSATEVPTDSLATGRTPGDMLAEEGTAAETIAPDDITVAEEVPTGRLEQLTDDEHSPRVPLARTLGEAQGAALSSEAEQAIAEVERILEGHTPPSSEEEVDEDADEDGGEDTVRLHPDAVYTRSGGRVTTPMRALPTKVLPVVLPPASSPVASRPYAATPVRKAMQSRLVRKRWQRETHGLGRQQRSLRVMTFAILAVMLLFVLVPVGAGVAAYAAYNNISGVAHDGINHLLDVKALFSASKSDPTSALTAPKLQQAQSDFQAAQSDFLQLQQLVNRPDVQGAINQFAPQYGSKLGMAQSLIQVALDVSRMGSELSGVALIGANILHGSPLATASAKPLLSVTDVEAIEGSMVHALYYINDIRTQLSHVSIKDLPLSDAQKAQLTSLLPLLPKAEAYITQAQGLIGMVSWLLGVGQPRRFLVQTMDRAELRPGGGFTGQYGILQIADGRLTPPSLTDVTPLDYASNGTEIGRQAPHDYSWMNFGNWGVRDSNLSGDFPTTARMTMQVFQDEGGGPLDGDIAFTPVVISNVLDVTGPIKVPGYNETITSKNLEERLHYYQQDYSAIAREEKISGNYSHTGRKAFTSELSKLLLDRVRHLPVRQLLNVMKSAVKSIQSRDLEIYFTNPEAEAWLVNQGYSGAIDTFSSHDGFMVTQSNISISKASQYVHSTFEDDVTLDAQGGATHNLTITLNYQQTGPVYGNDTYADYIRVYAPKSAQLQSGNGFDSGHAICSPRAPVGTPTPGVPPPVSGCGSYSDSFNGARDCPNGDYALGFDGMLNRPFSVDTLGPPTELTSDLRGRAMWGGLTETPKNCISTITLSWYVPNAVKTIHGQPLYSILVQKQGGMVPTIVLHIDASAIKGLKSLQFQGDITADRLFTLVVPPPLAKK